MQGFITKVSQERRGRMFVMITVEATRGEAINRFVAAIPAVIFYRARVGSIKGAPGAVWCKIGLHIAREPLVSDWLSSVTGR